MTWTLPADAWPTVTALLELLEGPWPEDLARLDLAYLRWEAADRGARPMGRRALAQRWGWPERQVRAFLDREPVPRASRQCPAQVRGDRDHAADPSRARPASVPEARQAVPDAISPPSPRPVPVPGEGVPGTGVPPLSPRSDRPASRSCPAVPGLVPPHTPPLIFPTDDPDQRSIDQEGVQGEGDPLAGLPGHLVAQAQAHRREVDAFLRVWLPWRTRTDAPARWRGGRAEAVAWWLEVLAEPSTTELGAAVAALDLVASLEAWSAWLADKAAEASDPDAKGRSKFPRNWKSALRTWLINQRKFGRSLRGTTAQGRRGSYAGRPTPYAVATTAPTSTPTPTTHPPGDLDALERF